MSRQADRLQPRRPRRDPRGRQHPRQRREGHPRPQGPQRRHREELRLAGRHQGRRHRRQGDRARRQAREHGRADGARGRVARRATRPATAPRPRPCSRRRSTPRASSSSRPAHNPMDLKRGIDAAVAAMRRRGQEARATPTKDKAQIAQVGTISANGDATIGNMLADAMEKVGKEGVITVEEAKGIDRARDRRGHAVRPRLPVALLRHRPREDGGRARRPAHPHQREEDLSAWTTSCRCSSRSRARRAAAAHHRRGRRGRGARDARREQAPRHAQGRAPSRRRASAIAARRCSRTSRSSPAARSSCEDLGVKLESADAQGPRHAPSASRSTRTTRRSSTARATKADQGPHRGDPQADRDDHQRLRQGEAPGAPREARGRRRRRQGRRRAPRPR